MASSIFKVLLKSSTYESCQICIRSFKWGTLETCRPKDCKVTGLQNFPKGPFTNYVTHFSVFFDHPPTHSNALAIILLMTYNTRVCYSNTFANHPPTPPALRNMWMTPCIKTCQFHLVLKKFAFDLRSAISIDIEVNQSSSKLI